MLSRVVRGSSSLLSVPAHQRQQLRRLNLHEYQSLEIMKSYGVATPAGLPANTPEEAEANFNKIVNGRRA